MHSLSCQSLSLRSTVGYVKIPCIIVKKILISNIHRSHAITQVICARNV